MQQPNTIYLEAVDDLSQVIMKIGRVKNPHLVLAFPKGALMMHSPLNLKVLKRWLDQTGRIAHISIADKVGTTIASQAGFQIIAPTIEPIATTESEAAEDIETDDADPTTPELSLSEDIEFIANTLPQDDQPITVPFVKRGLGLAKTAGQMMRPPQLTNWKLKFSRQSKFTILFGCIGLVILGSVGYFAIPKATIRLEVQSEPFKKQFALIVADEQDSQAVGSNILTGRFLEVTRENVTSYSATGEKNNGAKAEGKIVVINHTGSIAGLLANTRFKAANGLIFRLKSEILVPPARGGTPGRATVEAVADEGGTKYNLTAPMKLTVPGLADNAQALVYGEISGTFTGGTDEITKIVSEEDINQAKEAAAKNVFAAAEAELQKQLKRNEEIISSFIQNDVVDAIPSVTAGATKDQFEVRVQSRSWVIAIPKNKLNDAIFNAAVFEVPESKQITDATVKSAKVDVTEGNFLTHRIHLAISLDGRVGPQLNTDDIIANLANQPVASAKNYLQGLTTITSSSVDVWPKIISRVPLLRNNIKLSVIYLGE